MTPPPPPTRTLAVLTAAAALCLTACVRFPSPPKSTVLTPVALQQTTLYPNGKPFQADADPDVMVWLLADEIHTAMVFPYEWLLKSGFTPPPNFGTPPYVTMSWGERTAYTQEQWLNTSQVLKALLTPSPAVMEMIPIRGYVAEVCLQQRVYRKLVPRERGPHVAAFLNQICRTQPNGIPHAIGPSSWGDGVLLDSRFSYYLPRICNVWTAQAIEACGGHMIATTALTANGLIRQALLPKNGFEPVWPGTFGEKLKRDPDPPPAS